MNENKLGSERMTKLIVNMGLPSMMGMLVIALYNIVDTFFISGLGTEQVAAASVVFPIMLLVSGVAFAFGSGAASSISRLLGEKNTGQAKHTANTAFFSALAIAAVIAAVIALFFNPILRAFGATASVLPYARTYGLVILIGSVINVGTVTANNMVRSEGFAKISMITMTIGAGVNIILDPILIYGFDLGILGAAMATILAQATALGYILLKQHSSDSLVKINLKYFRLDPVIYKEILKIGIPVLIYHGLNSLSIGIINQQASFYGAQAVAAMGIVTKIIVFMSYVVFGFVKGLQPIVGYNYGGGQYGRVSDGIRITRNILSYYCILIAGFAIALSSQSIGLFTVDPEVLVLGRRVLIAWSITFVTLGYQMTYVTAFLAMGKVKEGSILGLSRQGVILIPLLIVFRVLIGFNGIILAQPVADLMTFMLAIKYAKNVRRELMDMSSEEAA